MRKQIALGIVFTIVGVVASQVVSTGQDARNQTVGVPPRGPLPATVIHSIDQEIRHLHNRLQSETKSDAAKFLAEKHAEILNVLNKYVGKEMAEEKFGRAIADFRSIINGAPGTEEAKRAEIAIAVLEGKTQSSTPTGDVFQGAPIEQRLPVNNPDDIPQF